MACTAIALALFLGCSSRVEENAAPMSRQPESPAATLPVAVAIDRAVQLAKADRTLSALLAPRTEGWQRDGGWATSPGWRAAERKRFEGIGARLPERADGTREVGLSRFERFRLRITPEGASAGAALGTSEGRAEYVDAWPSTDLVFAATEDRFEELLVLKDERAPTEFAWHLELPRGIKEVRREPGGGLTFADGKGEMVMQMPPAYAVDAGRTRRAVKVEWRDGRLTLAVDLQGLLFPVLVDPALATAVWEQKFPLSSPSARYLTSMAYDAAAGATVLFGGLDEAGSYLADTWAWDGMTWTQAAPAKFPPGRAVHAVAYDSTRKKLVLFGGQNEAAVTLGDTWEWDGTSWSERSPAASPSPRLKHALAYDSKRAVTVLFSGNQAPADTWEWDGTTWAQRMPPLAPKQRQAYGIAFDSKAALTVLFGGQGGGGYLKDTWRWDGNNWMQSSPSQNPSPRVDAPLVYDEKRGKSVLYGGHAGADALADTWEWDGVSWAQTTPAASPPRRYSPTLAYDSARSRVVLFGGRYDNFLNDTWEYHVRGEGCSSGTECDTGKCVDGVCCEQVTCTGTCMACDTAANPGVCSPVTNAQDADTCTGTDTCGATGQCGLPNGQTCKTTSQCSSRFCSDGLCCDAECSDSCDACNGATQGWPGAVDGTCTKAPLSFIGDPACGAYACTGASESCPTSCTADAQCAPNDYCAASATCQPRKAQAGACDLNADCAVAGCRECATGETCRDGVCCNGACGGACRTCADTPGTCTAVKSADDADTCTGSSTCSAAGACKLRNGESCDGGAPTCASGLCADGVCCNMACAGGCDTCSETPGICTVVASGSPGANPSCAPYACVGAAACPKTCDSDAGCATGFYCSANGACVAQKSQGATCNDSAGSDCNGAGCRVCAAGAGSCLDGLCCNAACGDADHYCDAGGGCQPRKRGGATCTAARECLAVDNNPAGPFGYCVDSVCCDAACTNDCSACAAQLKASGTDDGVCGPARTGTDPHNSCAAEPTTSCGRTGNCDGAGDCQLWPQNTACGTTFCTLNNVTGKVCSGVGVCVDVTALPCAPYLCQNSACTSPCDSSAQCDTGYYCLGGVCSKKEANARPCTTGDTCDSGFCTDGVCCNAPCSGQCEACAMAGSVGVCKAVKGTPIVPRADCTGAPPCQGSCDGGDRTACSYPDQATACGGPAKCTGDVVLLNPHCDGSGACTSAEQQTCAPYGCDADKAECRDQCVSDADCAAGAACEVEHQRCAPAGNTCTDAYTVKRPSGEESSCAPYRCLAGACQQQCSGDSDCADGYACINAVCEKSTDASTEPTNGGEPAGGSAASAAKRDSGCGCRVAGALSDQSSSHLSMLALLAVGALAGVRRRGQGAGTGAQPSS